MNTSLITNFSKSNEYRRKIHNFIPGGAHTYSKGDDQFPELSPAAITHGKGVHVWDLDGNKYLDCSMGLTSVSLGHAYEPVIKKVREVLEIGANFQRPAVLELEMAESFLSLIPSHQMIKFAKNGSTVTTAATKIARAYTNRKLIAFPGNHPFYSYDDWFIGKTSCNWGVPEEIQNLSLTYDAGNLSTLEELFKKYPGQIACVISEPERSYPLNEFDLVELINLTHEHGALFIQDEMITGFKTDFPGSIKKYGVAPDMATWGKGIANGFAFCALTGKKEVMELGGIRNEGEEKLFLISTTHGGELSSMAAALATIEEFKNKAVIKHNHEIGDLFLKIVSELIEEKNLSEFIHVSPCNWFPIFIFRNKNNEICPGMRTLVMQEMIKRGVLFQGAFVPCYSHTTVDVECFANALSDSLDVYRLALDEGFQEHLVGRPARPVFRKYI